MRVLIILITSTFYSSPTFCTVTQITNHLWFLKASGDLQTVLLVELSPSWVLSHQHMHTDTHFRQPQSLSSGNGLVARAVLSCLPVVNTEDATGTLPPPRGGGWAGESYQDSEPHRSHTVLPKPQVSS